MPGPRFTRSALTLAGREEPRSVPPPAQTHQPPLPFYANGSQILLFFKKAHSA